MNKKILILIFVLGPLFGAFFLLQKKEQSALPHIEAQSPLIEPEKSTDHDHHQQVVDQPVVETDLNQSMKRRYPNQNFQIKSNFSHKWAIIKDIIIANYKGMEPLAAARSFWKDHGELWNDVPPGTRISHYSVRSSAQGSYVTGRLMYQGYSYPGTRTLYFNEKGEIVRIQNESLNLDEIDLTIKISENHVREIVKEENQKAQNIRLGKLEITAVHDGQGKLVYPVEFDMTQEGKRTTFRGLYHASRDAWSRLPHEISLE